ncbi:MAG TPA: 3-keto-5-aminohexanoate cleavage protein [Solirubrobacteraceae bacterium]|nr:3-keto-5-aminohexanoate cleavage protein [Solirubrobacteraceae bacterium]
MSLHVTPSRASPRAPGAVHLHPRDERGRERLDAHIVDHVVTTVRDACGVPVGVSTGHGEATWVLIEDAVRRGLDTRVGLEDTQYEPDRARTDGNEALVRRQLGPSRHLEEPLRPLADIPAPSLFGVASRADTDRACRGRTTRGTGSRTSDGQRMVVRAFPDVR